MPTTDYTVPHHVRPAIAQLANTPTGLALRQWDDAGDSNLKSAHQALLDAQRRLQTDAKAYFTRLAMPRAPAVLDRDGAPAHLADRLGALLRRDGGIVLGGMPLPPIDSTPLIALLATLKQQGAGTLFIAGLLADVHQDALDRCVSEPQTPLPDTLTAFAGATMTRLLQGARQHGYRLVALDCAATVANAALAPRERAEIANYFAQLVIGEYASQPTHALWLAWLDETRLSRFDDVPGMAALTGAAGVRLRLASAQPAMRQDHGEQVVRTDGTRYWVKSDWLLSSHPLIGQARLRARLHDAGTFAIVARPESGEFELCHRAHDLSLITTPIQRDHVSPQLFFIERDDAGAHWQPVLRRRYRDLSALRQALQEIEMVDAWPDATPVLETAALGDAGERRAGVIALPDAVTPTSGLRVYEHGGEDAAQLEAIAREESRGLDLRYVSPLLSEPDRQLRKRFASKRERLLTDAALFFRQPTLPARPPMPTLAPELAMAEALNRLLAHYPGIVFGESHQDCHSKQLLIEHMPALHSAGVRTLYFEHLLADRHQPLLDAWHADPGAPMPAALQSYLQWQDRGQRVAGNANFTALAQAAHRHGIAIVAIDCFSSYFTKDLLGAFDRQQLMNYYAMRRIEARQSQMPGAKWIALVGSTHVTRF
ncbi:MAG: ChaN family lipoprotein, partial [Paludibacterium sp.]